MNSKLRNRILKAVKKSASTKVAELIMKTIDKDLILPILNLTARSKVKINIDDRYIYVYVGRRDFQFYAKSGRLMGAGTLLV